ncbi:MAG: type II toxin-antitoxin system HicA family toxin [Betaproteobacteria bacterium]|nr:type II toxin-antitoxin system HicA family toxin [Betaproteobacteria bacterium]MBK9604911.1 type II toxin-antitoxin system HicA family toxin [Betaproteobacteria bacterium]
MKREDLLRHLRQYGCVLLREGGKHSVFVNRATRKATAVPRHREINEFLARKICRDLEVQEP